MFISVTGCRSAAAAWLLLPIAMSQAGSTLLGGSVDQSAPENYEKIALGVLIVAFLTREPGGLRQLLRSARDRVRIWPLRAW
jgi:branched-chain amino acid transport system permease protein